MCSSDCVAPLLPLPSSTEDKKASSSIRFHTFSRKESIPEDEVVLRERSFDYKHRYCGHCNTTTDIKEANFFGRSVECSGTFVSSDTTQCIIYLCLSRPPALHLKSITTSVS